MAVEIWYGWSANWSVHSKLIEHIFDRQLNVCHSSSNIHWYWPPLILVCTITSCFADIQVKELNKRASGQAFEVILSPSTPDVKGEFPLSPLKKKGTSLDEIKRKLEAAEDRRKVSAQIKYIVNVCEQTTTNWALKSNTWVRFQVLLTYYKSSLVILSEPRSWTAETFCWETRTREGSHPEGHRGKLQL